MQIDQIVSQYRFGMIARRWGALWVDGIILWSIPAIPYFALGKESYQTLLWLWIVILFAYIVLLEGLLGWTIGKLVFQIRVVNKDGQVPGLGRALIRSLTKLLEANPMVFGGLLAAIVAMLSKKRQRIGDMIAKTYVVMKDDIPKITPPGKSAEAQPSFVNVVKSIQEVDPAT